MKQLLLAALLLGSMAQAASTGTLIISGTVAPINDLTIIPNSNATAPAGVYSDLVTISIVAN